MFETPPLVLNYEALKHIADHFMPGSHGTCIDITSLQRGEFHEIRVLHFEDGWSCIARFTRAAEPLAKAESELATIEYVRKHTPIPMPEIYFVNHNENHVVGAAFVLMERVNGGPLDNLWEELSLEHKLSVIEQLAGVYGQLAGLKFDHIGSLKADGSLGPLLDQTEWWQPMDNDAFTNTADYLNAYMKEDNPDRTEAARALYPAIKEKLSAHLEQNASNPTLHTPYRLIHGDMGLQNVLVVQEDSTLPPKISGIIDWDWSYTGLLYYLSEYPREILDFEDEPESFDDNKKLRKHFVSSLANHFPKGSADREQVKQSFREKSHIMNSFSDTFVDHVWPAEGELPMVRRYLNQIGTGEPAYSGVDDWQPDSELESESEGDA